MERKKHANNLNAKLLSLQNAKAVSFNIIYDRFKIFQLKGKALNTKTQFWQHQQLEK